MQPSFILGEIIDVNEYGVRELYIQYEEMFSGDICQLKVTPTIALRFVKFTHSIKGSNMYKFLKENNLIKFPKQKLLDEHRHRRGYFRELYEVVQTITRLCRSEKVDIILSDNDIILYREPYY